MKPAENAASNGSGLSLSGSSSSADSSSGDAALTFMLTSSTPVVALRSPIQLQLEVVNTGDRAVQFDDGCLTSYAVLLNAKGEEIAQWPFTDILAEPPGREAFWTLGPKEHKTIDAALSFRCDTWSGFGIPDGSYTGCAVEIDYPAGQVIHAVTEIPSTISITYDWTADAQTARSRADRLGLSAGWSGELVSNAVEIRLVSEPALQ